MLESAAVTNQGDVQKWIAVSAGGGPIREGQPSRADISQLQLSPDGRVLTFSRQLGTLTQTVGVSLADGQEAILANVPDGTRYYSADGRTMLVLTPYPGALHLFDVTNPLHPSELGAPVQTSAGHFLTGAVSADGAIVAVQMLEPLNNPNRALTRVVAYDRNLNQKAVVAEQATNQGLQFEGRFLFVGVQRHPIPAGLIFTSTDHIQVYDLSGI